MYTSRRTFDRSAQLEFERISGDCSPIHLSAIGALRIYAAAPIAIQSRATGPIDVLLPINGSCVARQFRSEKEFVCFERRLS